MHHRHLNITLETRWCLAALDDRISRGGLADWVELLRQMAGDASLNPKLWRIIKNYPEPDAQSYRFFERILEGRIRVDPAKVNWDWSLLISCLAMRRFQWEDLLSVASYLQRLLPSATLVGGTATALHCHHRISFDADHVIPDLRENFDEVLADLETVAGWKTARCKRPVLILGSLDGIETGIRQLIRSCPLETEIVATPGGNITVPTVAEMLRIKSFLILRRNATRDYLDTVALAEVLGSEDAWLALRSFDEYYPQPNGQSMLQQLLRQLAQPLPFDLDETNLLNYKQLIPAWQNWANIEQSCHHLLHVLSQALTHTVDYPDIDWIRTQSKK